MLLLLAGAAAAAPDAGTPDRWADPLYAECPAAPQPTQLDDGSWKLAPLRAARNTCLLVTCDERRLSQAQASPAFSPASWTLAIAIGLLAAIAGGYLAWALRGFADGRAP